MSLSLLSCRLCRVLPRIARQKLQTFDSLGGRFRIESTGRSWSYFCISVDNGQKELDAYINRG
jgi:hypothetical protein